MSQGFAEVNLTCICIPCGTGYYVDFITPRSCDSEEFGVEMTAAKYPHFAIVVILLDSILFHTASPRLFTILLKMFVISLGGCLLF